MIRLQKPPTPDLIHAPKDGQQETNISYTTKAAEGIVRSIGTGKWLNNHKRKVEMTNHDLLL